MSSHTDAGQPRPGMRITGRPLPETRAENAVGCHSGAGVACMTTCAGAGAGAGAGFVPPQATMAQSNNRVRTYAPYTAEGR